MVDKIELSEYQHAKDLIKVGEVVKVRAHGMTPFSATVRRIVQLPSGTIEVEVIDPRYRHFRTVTPDRVTVPKAKKRTAV